MANPFAVAVKRGALTGPISPMPWRPSASSYAGAQTGRLAMDWFLGSLSADQALGPELDTLRTRAQELCLNNSTASSVPRLFSENVIGKDGILYQSRVRNSRNSYNEAVNLKLEDAWYRWSERQFCSVDGRRSWGDTQTLIAESEPRDGEVLIQLVRGFPNEFGFAVDVLDPAQLDASFNQIPREGRNEIRMGVEVDAWGRPIAYHLWSNHPGEVRKRDRQRVPASDIIHLYVQQRPKQTRGVTWFAPVIIDLKMLGGYREAELVAARTAAAKMGWIVQKGEQANPPMTADDPAAASIRMDADPGVIEQLPHGFEFQGWDPTHPSTAYKEFNDSIVRSIAVAMRVSYMSLSGDLNGTSYGSGRIGLLSERTVYEKLQQRFIECVSEPVKRAWLEMAMLSGAVSLPSYDAKQYQACAWHPRSFPWIDPAADSDTAEKELNILKITSRSREAGKHGLDYETILQERKRDRELEEKYGEPEAIDPNAPAQLPAGSEEDTDSPRAMMRVVGA